MESGLSGALIQGLLQGRVAVVDDPEWMPGSERRYPCNRDGAVVWNAKELSGRMFLPGGFRVERLPGIHAAQRQGGRDASHAVKVQATM